MKKTVIVFVLLFIVVTNTSQIFLSDLTLDDIKTYAYDTYNQTSETISGLANSVPIDGIKQAAYEKYEVTSKYLSELQNPIPIDSIKQVAYSKYEVTSKFLSEQQNPIPIDGIKQVAYDKYETTSKFLSEQSNPIPLDSVKQFAYEKYNQTSEALSSLTSSISIDDVKTIVNEKYNSTTDFFNTLGSKLFNSVISENVGKELVEGCVIALENSIKESTKITESTEQFDIAKLEQGLYDMLRNVKNAVIQCPLALKNEPKIVKEKLLDLLQNVDVNISVKVLKNLKGKFSDECVRWIEDIHFSIKEMTTNLDPLDTEKLIRNVMIIFYRLNNIRSGCLKKEDPIILEEKGPSELKKCFKTVLWNATDLAKPQQIITGSINPIGFVKSVWDLIETVNNCYKATNENLTEECKNNLNSVQDTMKDMGKSIVTFDFEQLKINFQSQIKYSTKLNNDC